MEEQEKREIYEKFSGKVLGYIQQRVQNLQIAEDLCADVFVKIYEKLGKFDSAKASISTWIFTITRNTVIDYYRTAHTFEELPENMADKNSIEESICREEMLETLAGALETLPERERDILILHYYSGKTLKEIAQTMGISYSYIKILHQKALEKLKEFF